MFHRREKTGGEVGSLSDPEIRIPSAEKSKEEEKEKCIYDPNPVSSPPFKHRRQWKPVRKSFLETFSLCLQVKQDLGFKGGGVRVGDC